MSALAYTASFVRMGRSPFGPKPKEVGVFAQHLTGGLTLYSSLIDPGPVTRIFQKDAFSPEQLMAGFAIAEPLLPLEGEAKNLLVQLRELATSGDLEVSDQEASVLAEAVSTFNINLILNDCSGGIADTGLDLTFGDWSVFTTSFDWE